MWKTRLASAFLIPMFLTASAAANPPLCLESTPSPVWVPAGETQLGDNRTYREEGPAEVAQVDGFWIDATEVTNADFAAFVDATGYVTTAESPPDLGGLEDVPEEFLQAGSIVFEPLSAENRTGQWWVLTPGAYWKAPGGPDTHLDGLDHHPVVHITLADAEAYAAWVGGRLPTETEWERAARAGGDTLYIWGDEAYPDDGPRANTWQGIFPVNDEGTDGHRSTAPVGCFPPNDFGLYDMAGNVWEWTSSPFTQSWGGPAQGPDANVIKGGSWLCSDNFCHRFRPAARQSGDTKIGTSHTGFRVVYDRPPPGD